MAVDVRVLGGVEVLHNGRRLDPGPARQQCVLAALLVDPNTKVSIDQVIERVWPHERPRRARTALHSYIYRLRTTMTVDGELEIVRRGDGYVINVDEQALDLRRFHDLVAGARGATDPADLLGQALALWRGPAFAGLDAPWLDDLRATLELERVAAVLDHADHRLRMGQHTEVLATLSTEAERRPLDERLAELLMLALYRSGRQADALRHYAVVRSHLADELGIDPGPALRELHQRILTTDQLLTLPAPAAPKPDRPPTPHQLPAAPRPFTGRAPELAQVTAAMNVEGGVPVCTISGTGGVGKTWLALHWAHRHADEFPDGQLYVNLRGSETTGGSAVRDFLTALGVDGAAMPAGLDAQVGLYRSLVAGRRILIVVDNATDSGQVVPLLPGSSSCAALVTSRDRLTELVTAHGAHPVRLDVLTEPAAHALLAARLSADRLAAEPGATAELLRYCAGLPLALSIVAGRALTHPAFPLSVLADELRDANTRLGVLDDDPNTGVRTVLSWSTATLTDTELTVFGLLGLAPGVDIGMPGVAALAGLPRAATHTALRALARGSLLHESAPDRYRMHELVRLYAAELAAELMSEADRESALMRLIDFAVHTAVQGSRLLSPRRPPPDVELPPAEADHPLGDAATALRWFTAGHTNLLAIQTMAAEHHRHDAVWLLAWALNPFHRRRGWRQADVDVWRAALTAAGHLERHALAYANYSLGSALSRIGEHTAALEHLQPALAMAEECGDLVKAGHSHYVIAVTWGRLGEDTIALEHAMRGLRVFESIDLPVWKAHALNLVGWFFGQMGRYADARNPCLAALDLFADLHDRGGEADTLGSLAFVAHGVGDCAQAVEYYRRAINLYREVGDEYAEANALDKLAGTYATMGRQADATTIWHRALRLYQEHRRTEAVEQVRDRLADLHRPPVPG